MKLDRLMSGAFAAAAVALACGCSSTSAISAPAKLAQATPQSELALTTGGTTSLMSAQIPGPAPKVGKAHLAVDDELGDQDAPKDARHSDGSRRGGGFGSAK